MFGSIGMPELILIFIVALLVFGPKKLPELGKSLGRGLAEFKRASDDLKKTIEDEIEQGKHEADAVRKQVAEVRSTIDPTVPLATPAADVTPAQAVQPSGPAPSGAVPQGPAPQGPAPQGSVPRTDSPIRPV
jgi:TatA/E family protein of Tat protein translocase